MQIEEITKAIEIEKKKGEAEFKKSIGLEAEEVEDSKVKIIYPHNERIEELSKMIEQFSGDEIKDALMKREGEIYELVGRRGTLIRTNFENREEIARINVLLAKMKSEEKELMENAIKSGNVEEPVNAGSLAEDDRADLVKYINRCGIVCSVDGKTVTGDEPEQREKDIIVSGKKIWVNSDEAEKIEKHIKKMEHLGSKLQISYAKKHVVKFSKDEEEEYNAMQREYIELMKVKDELLSQNS